MHVPERLAFLLANLSQSADIKKYSLVVVLLEQYQYVPAARLGTSGLC